MDLSDPNIRVCPTCNIGIVYRSNTNKGGCAVAVIESTITYICNQINCTYQKTEPNKLFLIQNHKSECDSDSFELFG